jgi:lysophospholipase II
MSTTDKLQQQQQSQPRGAIIFLHGLGGGSPNRWEVSLRQQLVQHQSHLSNLIFLFPNAPILPISINGGKPMPGWFDLYDWPIDIDVKEEDYTNINTSITIVKDTIMKCQKDYNLSLQQIIIGGFSQGGVIALLLAYHPIYGFTQHNNDNDNGTVQQQQQQHFGGCINLSGWLPFRNNNNKNEWDDMSIVQKENIPLFWGHGQYDDKVLFQHQKVGIDVLKQNGVLMSNIVSKQYPIGHWSHPNEMRDVAQFIDQILFKSNQDIISKINQNQYAL